MLSSLVQELAAHFAEIKGPIEDGKKPPEEKNSDDENSQIVDPHQNMIEDDKKPPEHKKAYDEIVDPHQYRLIDLPREILTMIVEDPCIDLEDRKHLRATCKAMESIVAESDWTTDYKDDLYMYPGNSYDAPGPFGMSVPIFESGSEEPRLLRIQYKHAVGRLFRVAHFNTIFMSYLNFKPTQSDLHNKMIDELLKLSMRISCYHLKIVACDETYHPRMFDVIKNIDKVKKLELDMGDARIESKCILDLSLLDSLQLTCHEAIFDDHILLTLLTTHCSLHLVDGRNTISKNTFLKAKKLIEALGHSLSLQLHLNVVLTLVGSFGITMQGNALMSTNPEISVASDIEMYKTMHKIEMGETTITFDSVNNHISNNTIVIFEMQNKQ